MEAITVSVDVSALAQGPGTLFTGDFGTAEPAQTPAGLAADPGAGWQDVGGTTDGASLNIMQEFSELMVDQVIDVPGRRLTKRDMSLATNLAEIDLNNLTAALNGGSNTVPIAGVALYEPATGTSATQPDYKALILDCFAPAQLKRRITMRRVLNTNGVEFAYTKDAQTVYTANWSLHYVSSSIRPFDILDATS